MWWLRICTGGEISQAEAASTWGVDVSTVIGIRRWVKDCALVAVGRTQRCGTTEEIGVSLNR